MATPLEKMGLRPLKPKQEKSKDYLLMKKLEKAIPGARVICGMNSMLGFYVVNVSLMGYVSDEQIATARVAAVNVTGLPATQIFVAGGYDDE